MQFHLSTLLWVTLVFATSMGLAGVWGVPCAIYWIALLWLLPARKDKGSPAYLVRDLMLVLGFIALCAGLLWPAMPRTRGAARRLQCRNNLLQIGLGLANYREHWKSLPPPATADPSDNPLHSWRLCVLPFIEHTALYEKCDLKLAWNEGKNAPLLSQRLSIFTCPSDPTTASPTTVNYTNYFAVVGPGTVWDPKAKPPLPAAKAKPLADTRIMVIEVSNSGIAWAEPKDFTLDEVLAAADDDDPKKALPRSEHSELHQVFLTDTTVRLLPQGLSREVLKTLFTQGFTPEAEREIEHASLRASQEQQCESDREFRLKSLTFVVWLASVIGFGVHAWRLRRSAPGPATDKADEPTPLPPQSECDHDAKRADITGSSAVDVGEERNIAGRASDVPGA